jgi:hypothetical protein
MPILPLPRATKSIACSRTKCAGAGIVAGVVIGAGAAAVIGVGVAGTGAGAEGTGAGIAAAGTVAGAAVTGNPDIIRRTKKPRASGAFVCDADRSDVAAASIGPGEADRADAANGPHNDDRGRPHDDNGTAATIGLASAIGTAMPAGAASARGIRGAEACERAGDQNCCCEKVLHVLCLLPFSAATRLGTEPRIETMNGK